MLFKSIALERVFTIPTRILPAFVVAALYSASVICAAQTNADTRDLQAYTAAVSQARTADQVTALAQFVTNNGGSRLEVDALELLVWDFLRTGNRGQAESWANQLSTADPANPMALAVLSDYTRRASRGQSVDQYSGMAQRGMSLLPNLRRPEGMVQTDFDQLHKLVRGILNGVIGHAELHRTDYVNARQHLREAVTAFPDNSEYTYALALADLSGKDTNPDEGYWYLARTVNLARGTPAGARIAEYASSRYQEDGGKPSDWNQFLAAAARGTSAPGTVVASAKPAPAATAGSGARTSADNRGTRTREKSKREVAESKPPKSAAKVAKEKPSKTGEKSDVPPLPEVATNRLPRAPNPETARPPRHIVRPGTPVSIGLLVETASANKENRQAILDSLSDVVRELRPDIDEAFLLTYGNDLDMPQDLTGNYRLLEKAMDDIKPNSGAALFDAVTFAAGHLNRIAKNKNRVLLVISDGRNANSHSTSFELASQISDVRIYCIGVGVDAPGARNLLQALASHSGGQASFVSSPEQFETATLQMARGMGMTVVR
jgi:hypothetical protein